MGRPQSLFTELTRWRDKAAKRGKTCTFKSNIIPDWLNAEIVAAMETVGHVKAFSFLKQAEPGRMAAEREIEPQVLEVLEGFQSTAERAVRAGEQPDYEPLTAALMAIFVPFFTEVATEEALRVSAEIGIQFDPAVINQQALAWAQNYSFELVTGLTNTTRQQVSQAITSFIATPGMTQGDIAKLLAPTFGQVRADMIAVTEVTRAYSEATNEIQRMINQTGLQMARIWHTARDDRVCPICGPLDGLPESEWRGEFPKGPPAHVRCRCSDGLSAAGNKFHIREGIALARERIEMLDEMGEAANAEAARQQLKELRERVRRQP